MTEGEPISVAEFGAAFKAFLDSMAAAGPVAEPPFVALLRSHLGAEPAGLPVLSESMDEPDHANVQVAMEDYLAHGGRRAELVGVSGEQKRFMGMSLSDLIAPVHGGFSGDRAPQPGPVDYVNLPVGPGRTLPCVQYGLYLVAGGSQPLAVLVRGADERHGGGRLAVEAMAAERETAVGFLADLRERMGRRNVYRGQVVSLGRSEYGSLGITFHELPAVDRDGVVLADGVLERIERDTVVFARHGDALLAVGRHLKRGLLLHGPPGTGKTLSVMYLAGQMPGRTVLLLTGAGFGTIKASCALARALEPAMVVLEDVDLVAEERTMSASGQNPLLFELLNEMDGLADDADVIFVLTTNRPDLLEPALAARPGRIDQAVEIALPDAACRRRLLLRYGSGLDLRLERLDGLVARTEGVSAAFVKELLRKAALLAAEEGGELIVTDAHVDRALDELSQGGALVGALLGASRPATAYGSVPTVSAPWETGGYA